MSVPAPDVATDARGWFHPRDQREVVTLVQWARRAGQHLRVRGAAHSVPASIAGADDRIVVLDRLRKLAYDPQSGEVTVGGGVRLGRDPLDPHRDDGQALCPWLHARGRALSIVAGILHQTLPGFFATGSGGGSTCHDALAAVVGLRFVDGRGDLHTLRRGIDDELMNAVLVSVGACGIVTELTLHTEPAYDVAGLERVLPDRSGAVDLFADDDTGLTAFFARHEYARILWWPQRAVRRMSVWQANRVEPEDPEPPRAYQPLPVVGGSTQPLQIVGGAVLWGIVHWRRVSRWLSARAMTRVEGWMAPVEGWLYRAFVDGDPKRPQRFRGAWWEILPQDAKMDERWMPTTFTEIFIPLEVASEAMCRLEALFTAQPNAAGRFAIELYAAPASSSWLHPSYGHASLRINIFWLMHEPADPRDTFFPRFWETLAPFGARLHWGKLFPHTPASTVVGRFPRLADFLAVRKRLDPDQIFLTSWLAAALGVNSTEPACPTPRPARRRPG